MLLIEQSALPGVRLIRIMKNPDNFKAFKTDYGKVYQVTFLHTFPKLTTGNYGRAQFSILQMVCLKDIFLKFLKSYFLQNWQKVTYRSTQKLLHVYVHILYGTIHTFAKSSL